MNRILIILTLTTLLTACSQVDSLHPFDNQQAANLIKQRTTTNPTKQMIALNLPNKHNWQRIDVSYGTIGTPIMLIPNNETRDNWTQSFRTRISAYRQHTESTPVSFANQQIEFAKNHCAHTEGRTLDETPEVAIYQINMSDCQYEKNQWKIGKAMKGSDAVYLVDYATTVIDKTQTDKMTQVIKLAQLVASKTTRTNKSNRLEK